MIDDAERASDHTERHRHARERLDFREAILAALDRRSEVMDVIAESASDDEARASLRALLAISDLGAMAVFDLQFRRTTKSARARIVEDRDHMRRELSR